MLTKKSQDALLKLCQEAILSYMIPCEWSTCDTDTVCRDAVTTSNCRDGRVETQITLYHRFTAVRGKKQVLAEVVPKSSCLNLLSPNIQNW